MNKIFLALTLMVFIAPINIGIGNAAPSKNTGQFAPDYSMVIPDDRRVDWSDAGIQGGIPKNQIIFIDFNDPSIQAKYNVYPNDQIFDDEGLIKAFEDASQSEWGLKTSLASTDVIRVIKLPEGHFHLGTWFTIRNVYGVSIQGAGIGKTIIHINNAFILAGTNRLPDEIPIESGYIKGSTRLRVQDITPFKSGTLLHLFQENDDSFMWSRIGNQRLLSQLVMVMDLDEISSEIIIDPPLPWPPEDWVPTQNPQPKIISYKNPSIRFIGIEDISFTTENLSGQMLKFYNTFSTWVRNVEMTSIASHGIYMENNLRVEIRDSYFHDTTSTSDGYGIECYARCNALKIENNIFKTFRVATILNQTVNSVFAYNYALDSRIVFWPTNQKADFNANHGPHGLMTLYEGNKGTGVVNDGYHGSTSHLTFFRNNFHGQHVDPKKVNNRKLIDLTRYSHYQNIVGNVLGFLGWPKDIGRYEMEGKQSYSSQAVIYRLGYPNIDNNTYTEGNSPGDPDRGGLDPKVKETILRHGNYDYLNEATLWNDDPKYGLLPNVLPASLYLSSKPDWWEPSLVWPPIGPDVNGLAEKIPAEIRYDYYVQNGLAGNYYNLNPNNKSAQNGKIQFLKFKNVFNPNKGETLEVQYKVNKPGRVKLTILNRMGQEIVNENLDASGIEQLFQWDGTNNKSEFAASGIYIVQLEFGSEIIKKKVVVVK